MPSCARTVPPVARRLCGRTKSLQPQEGRWRTAPRWTLGRSRDCNLRSRAQISGRRRFPRPMDRAEAIRRVRDHVRKTNRRASVQGRRTRQSRERARNARRARATARPVRGRTWPPRARQPKLSSSDASSSLCSLPCRIAFPRRLRARPCVKSAATHPKLPAGYLYAVTLSSRCVIETISNDSIAMFGDTGAGCRPPVSIRGGWMISWRIAPEWRDRNSARQ